VLSVYSGCPGTVFNEITCNDDSYGLQSAVNFYTTTGNEYLTRVSGYGNATGSYVLNVQVAGAISGVVAQATTGVL
jgi:hypothetical protein